ncbi:hypothetical protein ISS37_01360 [candidate division KSB1 bacterium]|nr:hypothetical protein [candidate division KSB1 bacterium]
MPPSGFVRSSQFKFNISTGDHIFITSIPNVICPFIVELQFTYKKLNYECNGILPKKDKFSNLFDSEDYQYYVLINNHLFFLPYSTYYSLRTVPINQYGGDIYIGLEGLKFSSYQVKGFFRIWGDPKTGNYGQKEKILSNQPSSTIEGYHSGRKKTDLILNDNILELLHLRSSQILLGN